MEQNTYNQCPVCGFPLSLTSAICPRCGNDIFEDISSLDQQSQELHHQNIEGKKAEWYTRCLTEKLNFSTDNPAPSAEEIVQQQSAKQTINNSAELEFLRRTSRAELLRDGALRKKWWTTLTADWKEVIKTTLKIVRDPSDQEQIGRAHV